MVEQWRALCSPSTLGTVCLHLAEDCGRRHWLRGETRADVAPDWLNDVAHRHLGTDLVVPLKTEN